MNSENIPMNQSQPLSQPTVQNQTQPVVPAINPYTIPQVPKKPPRQYSVKENIYAWACFILAYLFTLSIPINENPLGLLIVIVLMYAVSTVVILQKAKKPQLMPIIVAASAVVVSTSLILTSNRFLHFFTYLYAMVAYCYYIYGLSSDHHFRFSDSIFIDFTKALFVLPFYSFSNMFVSMFSGKANKGGRFIMKVLCGIIATIIPTAIILALLSYDDGFSEIIDKIFNFEDFNLPTQLVKIIFALLLGAYAYSIYISSVDKKCENILTPQSCRKTLVSMRFAPMVTVLTSVLPILFIYVVFFISQWKYYVSGFTGVLPKGLSYAQYAREGFFQLCTVSVINLIILIVISLFLKRKENKQSVVLKILSMVFAVFTLVLISTALSKMYMYIDYYGLTPKRVYATWLMLVLAIVFMLIIVKQYVKKLKLIALSLAVLVVMFTALSLSGVEEFIAQYNVDRYIDGSLSTVDIDALDELGDPAIESLVRLSKFLDKENGTDIAKAKVELDDESMYSKLVILLRDEATKIKALDRNGKRDIWAFNVPSLKAEKALRCTTLFE